MRIMLGLVAAITAAIPLPAQWLNYPTPGVPRGSDGAPNFSAPAPRTQDGRPDLSGVWSPGQSRNVGHGKGFANAAGQDLNSVFFDIAWGIKDGAPYQPWAAELVTKRKADEGKDTTDTKCLPNSLVQKTAGPGAIHIRKFIQTPGLLIILYERNREYRQIFMDGRPLPVDPNPTWNGYSTGGWQGDTLVVQTSGFRDGIWADFFGSPLTDAAKVTERFRRPTYGKLEVEITVNDPKAYTQPWTVTIDQYLMLDSDLLEYICLENEKDASHLDRK